MYKECVRVDACTQHCEAHNWRKYFVNIFIVISFYFYFISHNKIHKHNEIVDKFYFYNNKEVYIGLLRDKWSVCVCFTKKMLVTHSF